MQYVQAIFENENVRTYVSENEQLIDLAAKTIASVKPVLVDYVFENLQDFTEENDLAATYENIKTFIIAENLYLFEYVSDILSDTNLSAEETAEILTEGPNKGFRYASDRAKAMGPDLSGSLRRGATNIVDKLKGASLPNPEKFRNDAKRSTRKKLLGAGVGLGALGAGIIGTGMYNKYQQKKENLSNAKKVAAGAVAAGGLAYAGKKAYDRSHK